MAAMTDFKEQVEVVSRDALAAGYVSAMKKAKELTTGRNSDAGEAVVPSRNGHGRGLAERARGRPRQWGPLSIWKQFDADEVATSGQLSKSAMRIMKRRNERATSPHSARGSYWCSKGLLPPLTGWLGLYKRLPGNALESRFPLCANPESGRPLCSMPGRARPLFANRGRGCPLCSSPRNTTRYWF